MSWALALGAFLAFLCGAVLSKSLRQHDWSSWRGARQKQFVRIERIHRRSIDRGRAYYADLAFYGEALDVAVTVEVFQTSLEHCRNAQPFKRWRLDTPIERSRCKDGTVESVQLIEARIGRLADTDKRSLMVSGRDVEKQMAGFEPSRELDLGFMVRLSVSALDRVSYVNEQSFRLTEEDLSHLPTPIIC